MGTTARTSEEQITVRILVTGSNGQVGSEVAAIVDAASQHELIRAARPDHDITNRDNVLGLITTTTPDVIIHCAAMTAVDLCESEQEAAFAVNAAATRFVADGARRVGAHVVYVSTDYVFDGTKDGPYNEWDEPNPQSIYGRSKLGGEAEIDPEWSIARTSWVCGFNGNNMVKTLLRLAGGGGEVAFVDDQIGHPTMAGDLASDAGQTRSREGPRNVPPDQPRVGVVVRVRPERLRNRWLGSITGQPHQHFGTRSAETSAKAG
ncbi:MAG: NAD(P)-dependent oxidoreductase [Microthrixaceae bacterium]